MGNFFAIFSAIVSTVWTWTLLGFATFVGYTIFQERDLNLIPGFDALPAFLRLPLQHQTESAIIFTLAGVVGGFVVFFLTSYVWQAMQDFLRLEMVRHSLRSSSKQTQRVAGTSESDIPPTGWRWFYYPLATRLWHEYAHTLHRQTLARSGGDQPVAYYRATTPAEAVFSVQALVDVPMRVEFFRHLPGILTGAGIVSTFAGILLGLSEFNPVVEAQQITFQLKNLFTGITTAFVASFFAIITAITITVLEKFLLHWRYAQVAALQHQIDNLFQSGIEPDYLASLVSDGKQGFQQLNTLVKQLTIHRTKERPPVRIQRAAPPAEPPHEPATRPLDSRQQERILLGLKGAVRDAFQEPLVEISQLARRTLEQHGARREEGRALEIQLESMGERLDVALQAFAVTMTDVKEEIHHTNETLTTFMGRQLDFMAEMTTHMAGVETHLNTLTRASETETKGEGKTEGDEVAILRITLEKHTAAMRMWHHAFQEMGAKLPSEEAVMKRIKETLKVQGVAFQQWTRSLDGLFQKLPSREEFIRLLQVERKQQTEALDGLRKSVDNALGQWPSRDETHRFLREVRASLETLSRSAPDATAISNLTTALERLPDRLMVWTEKQNEGLQAGILEGFAQQLQQTAERMAVQFAQLETHVFQERGRVQEALQSLMTHLSQVALMNETQTELLQGQADRQDAALGRVVQQVQEATHTAGEQVVARVVEQVLSAQEVEQKEVENKLASMAQRMEQELQQIQTQFQKNSDALAERLLAYVEQSDAQSESRSGARIQGVADQLAEELKTTLKQVTEQQHNRLQEHHTRLDERLSQTDVHITDQLDASLRDGLLHANQKLQDQVAEMATFQKRSQQEVAKKVSDVIFTRLDHTFGTLTEGMNDLRDRFASERHAIVSTMENWMADTSRSDREKTRQVDEKIAEVITHVTTHHDDLIGVLDLLNRNLSNDLEGMREKLLHTQEEGTQHLTRHVTDLGQVLEGVVNSVGQEQIAFIEMLGERLETLRRRMKLK